MVGTLIKHEFLRTRRWVAVVFGVATLLTLMGTLMAYTPWLFIQVLGLILSFVAVGAFFYVMEVALAYDYWRSSYSRTGYFTQSLPAKGSTVYGAKFLWGSIVTVVALLWNLVLVVPVLFGGSRAMADGLTWGGLVDGVRNVLGAAPPWVWVLLGVAVIVLALSGLAQFYFAASLGSEARMNRLGIGGPILVYFGLYLIMQVLLFVGIVAVPVGLSVSPGSDGLKIVSMSFLDLAVNNTNPDVMPLGFIPVLLIITALLVWRTVVSWNRKVSLA